MFPRVAIQLLLSLLLLVSQQLALAHGYTHVQRIGTEQLQGKDDGGQQAPAADSLCAQCLSADQLAYGLGVPSYHFRVAGNGYLPSEETFARPPSAKAVRAFQPRAPPRA
ncbi:hypothetical protein [Pseudoduganella umbonata]|uniref:DUF2946 domain-containing protein n=1 Tax=Pseudoduganella umbonata TaxID=864828 RepID=A0A4P8HSA1_9BURK|nr:hypothetical protein [Pseudoduganella umbonata]MBB3220379.1 hypothetical protein [Pseudoduganella umbonata]QCP12086.1 hypothetical protein FCL38_17940 [Pseudoduganella umbonata]